MTPLFGIGLQGKSPVVTSQYRLNVYYEFQPEDDKTKVAVYGTPGLTLRLDLGDTEIRGMHQNGSDYYYVVHRGTFYQVNNANTAASKGTLNTTEGKVIIRDNGTQIMITDDTDGYIYDIARDTFFVIEQVDSGTTTATTANKLVDSGGAFSSIVKAGMIVYNTTDSTKATVTAVDSNTTLSLSQDIFTSGENYEIGSDGFITPSSVEYLNTYFVVSELGTHKYQISATGNGADWDALEFSNADNKPDDLVRVFENNSELVLFGKDSTEFHVGTGAVDFPFQRVTSNEWGLVAKYSVAKFDNGLMFLARNADLGEAILVQMNGHIPQRVSSSEWEKIVNDYDDVTTATAYSYLLDGHPMYRINFDEGSWEYDGSTGLISALKSEGHTRHLTDSHIYYIQQNLVGDYSSGKVYSLDKDVYTDNGTFIKRQLRGKHVFDPEWNKVIVDRLQLFMETGVGLESGQGTNPQAMLRYSKDGGRTWGNEIWRTFGAIGEYLTRVIWRRLGAARDWVFEITITDPVKVVITNTDLRYRRGSS